MGYGSPHGGGMMGHSPMMQMVFILADTNGDGKLSLQEFQAAHERMFKVMDSNKDGGLTLEEMQSFVHGGRGKY
jgi:Ca2+-binding EF-hand superfamily protein